MIDKNTMIKLANAQVQAKKTTTPHDCQEIDKMLFAEMKKQESPAKWYAEMRGYFNAAWEKFYFQGVNQWTW